MRRRSFLGSLAGIGAGAVLAPEVSPAAAAVRRAGAPGGGPTSGEGGSNYGWYKLDGCNREPYGVINTFNHAEGLIKQQLKRMYADGQRRLRILIYHYRGPDTGTVMNSAGGNLSAQNRKNLTHLLDAIVATGYSEIQVSFLPLANNAAYNWTTWREGYYRENRELIWNLRPIIAKAGILYRIDLCNEAIPASNQPMLLQYAQRLWAEYTGHFGQDDTCGFSIIGMVPDRIQHIPDVYQGNPPYLFDFHFYRDSAADEYQQFSTAHQLMTQMGYTSQGWTVSEVYYDDATAAGNVSRAIADTGQTVFYLLQWPLSYGATCTNVSVAPPKSFGAYKTQGF